MERRRKSLSGTPLVRSVPIPSQDQKRIISTDFLPYADLWFSQPWVLKNEVRHSFEVIESKGRVLGRGGELRQV